MHVSLTDRLDQYVKDKVQSGLYNNASEVVRDALRLKIAAEEADAIKLQNLRHAIDPAWQDANAGAFAAYSLEGSLEKLKAAAKANGS